MATSSGRQNAGLQIIFSFFLGLMVTAFIGVGVFTFYPPPEAKSQKDLQQLYRQQEDLQQFKDPAKLTETERAELRTIQDKIRALEDKQQAEREVWGRNTSIILITFATVVMSVSLVRADQLPVISNGLLLGGVFTMVYGVGWIIATGTSIARFIVMTIALLITLALGYVRFVRGKQAHPGGEVAGPATAELSADAGAAMIGLDERVSVLERRIDAAASALGEREHQGERTG